MLQYKAALLNQSKTRHDFLLISNYIDSISLEIKLLPIDTTVDVPNHDFMTKFFESDLKQLIDQSIVQERYPSYVWISIVKLLSRLFKHSLFIKEVELAITTMIHAECLWDISKLFSLAFKYLQLYPSKKITDAVYGYCVKYKCEYLEPFIEECAFFGSKVFINTETFKNTMLILINSRYMNEEMRLLEEISGDRVFASFIRDDTLYIQLILSTINAFPNHCDDIVGVFDALRLFERYFESVDYDSGFLLDLVLSNETDILECLIKVMKYSMKVKEQCGCELNSKVGVMLGELRVSIKDGGDVGFNTLPLIRLIGKFLGYS